MFPNSATHNTIRLLLDEGRIPDAFTAINDYLAATPNDIDAILFKASLCLEHGQELPFVLNLLEALPTDPRTTLESQRTAAIEQWLGKGRHALRQDHDLEAACQAFDTAQALRPDDYSISLAAVFALVAPPPPPPSLGAFGRSPFGRANDDDERRPPPKRVVKTERIDRAETYVERMVEGLEDRLDDPSSLALLQQAITALLRALIDDNQLAKVVDLFDDMEGELSLTAELDELLALTLSQVYEHARHIIAKCLRKGAIEAALAVMSDYEAFDVEGLLTKAEVFRQQPNYDQARSNYEQALQAIERATATPPNLTDARYLLRTISRINLTCPACQNSVGLDDERCKRCEAKLDTAKLLRDEWPDITPPAVLAHIGIATTWEAEGDLQHAHDALGQAMLLLSGGDEKIEKVKVKVIEWRLKLRASMQPTRDAAVSESDPAGLLAAYRAVGLTPALQSTLERIPAEAWRPLAYKERLALLKAVIKADLLPLARHLLATAFEDNPTRKTLLDARAQLERATAARVHALLTDAQAALQVGHAEHALDQAENALAFDPDHSTARLIRGAALELTGHPRAALDAYYRVVQANDPATQHAARLAAARLLEGSWSFSEALRLLEGLEDEAARAIRARLERRRANQPYVRVETTTSMVMTDTLTRIETAPYAVGWFAVAVRQVARPWRTNFEDWATHILSANSEFVQTLNGLGAAVNNVMFGLRLISQPDPHVPERGKLHIALMVRVSADTEAMCQARALDLWQILKNTLPLVQDRIYIFEPVVDVDELAYLLDPFAADHVAEIVRREEPASNNHERYALYPFVTSGSPDLHNLCWTLLRQQAPAMVSIHLLPTTLMAWERNAFDRVMTTERRNGGQAWPDDDVQHIDPISQWWQGTQRWGGAAANRSLFDMLRSQAYVLGVNVAAQGGALLPEQIGAVLFGPMRGGGSPSGGYEVIRASNSHEFETARHNLQTLDVERWVYTAAPDNAQRLRHLVSVNEAVITFRLPIPKSNGIPGMALMEAKPVPPPPGLPKRGTTLGESVARVGGSPQPITQSIDDRRRHLYVVGKTGVGKSTLLGSMALQDIEQGHGVCVIDPHGDLVEDILVRIPPHRAADVIIFDPADEAHPIGLNLLEHHSETEKHLIVNEFIGLLFTMYDPGGSNLIVGPRFQHNVRNAMLTAMAVPNNTLIEVVRVISDKKYMQSLLPHVKDPVVRSYWLDQIANTSDFHKSEVLDYIVSKFSRFVYDQRVRHIIGQRQTTIDFRRVMDDRQILLVNLSKGKIGPENAQFLGLLMVNRLLLTALGRAGLPPEQRPDFFLYVDEFQNFATEMFGTMLSEGRKYGLAITIANQYLTQLPHAIREAIFGNVGSIVTFRLGTQDAAVMEPELYPVYGIDDIVNLPKYTAATKLLVDGVATRPFTMQTVMAVRPPDHAQAEQIRQQSRAAYGRDVSLINEDIIARFSQMSSR